MTMTRSENMALIRASNNRPETRLQELLRAARVRFGTQESTPGGKADIVIGKSRVAAFIDGCFWHGCPDHYVRPRSKAVFWQKKLRENVDRDRRQTLTLKKA